MDVIIKDDKTIGKTRSEQETNLRKDGYRTMTDSELAKLKWLERKVRERDGGCGVLTNIEHARKVGKD